jgi:hypothetical protein
MAKRQTGRITLGGKKRCAARERNPTLDFFRETEVVVDQPTRRKMRATWLRLTIEFHN